MNALKCTIFFVIGTDQSSTILKYLPTYNQHSPPFVPLPYPSRPDTPFPLPHHYTNGEITHACTVLEAQGKLADRTHLIYDSLLLDGAAFRAGECSGAFRPGHSCTCFRRGTCLFVCVCVYVCVCWHCLCCDLVTWSLVRFEGASVPYLQGVIKRLMPTEDRAGQVPSLHLCDLMGINICVLSVLLSSVCNYCTI